MGSMLGYAALTKSPLNKMWSDQDGSLLKESLTAVLIDGAPWLMLGGGRASRWKSWCSENRPKILRLDQFSIACEECVAIEGLTREISQWEPGLEARGVLGANLEAKGSDQIRTFHESRLCHLGSSAATLIGKRCGWCGSSKRMVVGKRYRRGNDCRGANFAMSFCMFLRYPVISTGALAHLL